MKGYVDRFDSLIAGWVYDPAHPNKAIDVVIECAGHELHRCCASIYRNDLIPVIGSGEHGFGFEPVSIPGFDRNMRIQIFALADKKHLLYEGDWVYEGVVAEGVDGWLFLNRDTNEVNRRIAGEIGVDSEEIYRTAVQMASREALLSRMEIPYLALIVPEKNVVCSKYYPGLKVSECRAVSLILKELQKLNSKISYPLPDFLSSSIDLYYRTDTHTNANGYKVIYKILQQELPEFFGQIELPTPNFNGEFCGDLGSKLNPRRTEETEEYNHPHTSDHFYKHDKIQQTIQQGEKLRGQVVHIINRNASRRLLIFGTSSAYHSLPIVSCAFAETIFVWENTFDFRIIEVYKPDCILWFPSERFLPMQVDDAKGLPETLKLIRDLM
ncbi:alginate O-acetyltransferase AlgX-related protein [Massilia timonae]|uniref:alginate O-acetyltransferase AlgX-related protein n=1 Tax=Massilia timonae TaxID=47229 RepID=UPI00289ED604|nr:hypothetical protein [Massilia timonae]